MKIFMPTLTALLTLLVIHYSPIYGRCVQNVTLFLHLKLLELIIVFSSTPIALQMDTCITDIIPVVVGSSLVVVFTSKVLSLEFGACRP